MGWTVLSKAPAEGWKAFLDANYTSATTRVLESAVVDSVYYAAAQITKPGAKREVTAIVTRIEGSGWKTMDESMGPYAWDCPASILAMLSPTTNELAKRWRAQCRQAA